jgi:hypothetical protein
MEKFLTRACLALVACMVVTACDSQEQMTAANKAASDDTKTSAAPSSTPDAKTTAEPGTPGGGEVKFAGLSDCLQSCEVGDKIPTNRETCKLNCDAAYGADARADPGAGGGDKTDPVGTASTCLGRCYAAGSAQDTCADGCKTAAAAAPSAPSAAVLDRLSVCVRTCHADKAVLATNRATCELNCAQAARVVGPAQP